MVPGKYEEAAEVSGPSRWGSVVSCVCRAQIVSDHIAPAVALPLAPSQVGWDPKV